MVDDTLRAAVEAWLADDPDPETRAELRALLERGRWDVGSSRVDLQACKLEYSIVSPK